MKALILTCNFGQGHNSVSASLKEVIERNGDTCEIKDAFKFLSPLLASCMPFVHEYIYRRIPYIVDSGYATIEKKPDLVQKKSLIWWFLTRGYRKIYKYIKNENFDYVICPHAFSAMPMTKIKNKYALDIPVSFVATDYQCSSTVNQNELDYFFIPAEDLVDEFVGFGIPKEKVVPSGIPVRMEFYSKTDKSEAKRHFGIDPETKHIIMMCGSMGCGPMKQLTDELVRLLSDSVALTIICGTNKKLFRQLNKVGYGDNVHILQYTKEVSLLMDSADLFLTKPGGISVTEAGNKKLPMVFIDAVAAYEEYNLKYFVKHGHALAAENTKDYKEVAELCAKAINDDELLAKLSVSYEPHSGKYPAEIIYDCMTRKE